MPGLRRIDRSLPVVGRDDLPRLRLLARGCPRGLTEAAEEAAGDLLGLAAGVSAAAPPYSVGPEEPAPEDPAVTPTVAVLLTVPEGPATGARAEAAVELDPELAAAVVHRVLGGDGLPAAAVTAAPTLPPGTARGALLYAAARLATAAGRGGAAPVRVSGVVSGRSTVVDALRGDPPAAVGCQPWRVRLGDRNAGLAWCWWRASPQPRSEGRIGPISPSDWRRIAGLAPMVRVEAARVPLAARELRRLTPGDVLLPAESWCAVDAGGAVRGSVALRLPGEPRARVEARVDGRGVRVQVPWTPTPGLPIGEGRRMRRMDDEPDTAPQGSAETTRTGSEALEPSPSNAPGPGATTTAGTTGPTRPGPGDLAHPRPELLAAAAEAPVEVAVEIGRFRLPLGELLAARPGEVLATGLVVPGDVRLTVGDHVVGMGELVEVDGSLGVRVTRVAPDPGDERSGR